MKVSELYRKLLRVHVDGPDDEIGGGLPTWFQSGSGSPVGAVTPAQQGALYQDTTNGALYEAGGVTDADWQGPLLKPGEPLTQIVGDDGGVGYESPDNVPILAFREDGNAHDRVRIYGSGITVGSGGAAPRTSLYNSGLYSDGGILTVEGDGIDLWLTGLHVLIKPASGLPDNAVGVDGNWALGNDGHIYFKASGAWGQKV